jgi:hypothetical protein
MLRDDSLNTTKSAKGGIIKDRYDASSSAASSYEKENEDPLNNTALSKKGPAVLKEYDMNSETEEEEEKQKMTSPQKKNPAESLILNEENLKKHNQEYEDTENPLLSRLRKSPHPERIPLCDISKRFFLKEAQPAFTCIDDSAFIEGKLASTHANERDDDQDAIDSDSVMEDIAHLLEQANSEEGNNRDVNYPMPFHWIAEPALLSAAVSDKLLTGRSSHSASHPSQTEIDCLDEGDPSLILTSPLLSSSVPITSSLLKKTKGRMCSNSVPNNSNNHHYFLEDNKGKDTPLPMINLSPIPPRRVERSFSLLSPAKLELNDNKDLLVEESERKKHTVENKEGNKRKSSAVSSQNNAVDLTITTFLPLAVVDNQSHCSEEKGGVLLPSSVDTIDDRLQSLSIAMDTLLVHCRIKTDMPTGAFEFANALKTKVSSLSKNLKNEEPMHAWILFETGVIKSINEMYRNPSMRQHREWFPLLTNIVCSVIVIGGVLFFGHAILAMSLFVGLLLKGCHSLNSSGNFYPFFDKTTRQEHLDYIKKEVTATAVKFC